MTAEHHPHRLDLIDDPHAHLSAALVLSLALWTPFGLAVMHGDLSVLEAGIRYLVAFVGCRFAVGGITHLLRSYRHMARATAQPVAAVPQDHGTTNPSSSEFLSPQGG